MSIRNQGGEVPGDLHDWQEMFLRIYGKINRVAGLIRVWLHVHEELGELSRAFRLESRSEIEREMADVFAWLMSFCNIFQVKIDEIVWIAYPGVCGTCQQKQCQCPKV